MMIECKCGCGQTFEPSRATLFRIKRGDNVGYIRGHSMRGERNPRWNDRTTYTSSGYKMVYRPDHPNARKSGYIEEHRLIMSEALGRPLAPGEIVHHINEDKNDNRPKNLELTNRPDHTVHHSTGEKNGRWKPLIPKTCPVCGTAFAKPWHGNQRRDQYCSRACMNSDKVGENAFNVKLTDVQVAEIRALKGVVGQRKIAEMFNVSKTQIGRIHRNESRND